MVSQVAGALDILGADAESGPPPQGASLGHGLPSGKMKAYPPAIRQLPIGFGVYYSVGAVKGPGAAGPEVVAGKALIAKIKLQEPYRVERLIIPSDFAPNFMVLQLRVGKPNVLATSDAVPARAFDETATYVLLGTDTGQQACIIALSVLNWSTENQPFSAALVGIALT